MKPAAALPAVVLLLLVSSAGSADGPLAVDAAWVRAMPPGADTTAAYMALHNPTSRPYTIRAVSSRQFEAAGIHQTRVAGGVARMVPLAQLPVPEGDTVVLEPGGYHIMLSGARGDLDGNASVELSLLLDDGSRQNLALPIRRAAP